MNIKHKKKVPYIEQMQQTECGVCCTAMLLRYYKSNESLSDLRKHLEAGRDGLKISQIKDYFRNRGFETHIYKASISNLSKLPIPAIIFWNNEHFVVLEKITESYFIIVDPALGRRKIDTLNFKKEYSNIILSINPTEVFAPKLEKKKIWKPILKNLAENKVLFFKVIMFSLVTYFINISIPIMVQYLIDEITLKNNPELLHKYILMFLGIIAVYGVVTLIRGNNLIDLQIKFDRYLNKTTIKKMFKLPYKYFEVRSKGDLLFRLNSLHVIRDIMSEQVLQGILNIGTIAFILVYMSQKSIQLTLVSIGLFLVTSILLFCIRPIIMQANQYEIVESTKLQSVQVEAVYSILGIKTTGIEDYVYKNWNDKYEKSVEKYSYRDRVLNIYNTVNSLTQTINPFIILIFGIYGYLNGNLSLGGVIAFYSLSTTFFVSGVSLFQSWNNFLLATSYLERISDITDADIEYNPENPKKLDIEGSIKLDSISFSYTTGSDPVIEDLSLDIKSGQKVAIVGASGSGKSTLSKILLGLYEPSKGDIYYDGINFKDLNKQEIRRQLGIVPQDISLFNKSIYENIKMNRENITMDDVKHAAKIAQISDEIGAMPMGYLTLVSDMGLNLSGGQRQRIALARAILSNPKVIILDEATSALDSINEIKVSNYFRDIGCTRIVIAHRLSTIIDSDVIYVMDKGRIVESGNHKELIRLNGSYASLYRAKEEKLVV
ncbi:peptidase domain-containing ABC transporter [Clostridium sp. CM028]|uniref:peptidase domain-containing ABC transporter n=1 Tax=unclassified Clostridium TaxID=2614128 RepID=UPI001C6EBFE3|nr:MULTISPECIES: peptidase domain-containing ABC transporter [unclassified Clostridium]MBW9145203.1 peptidase domain-containing ABC transporter [Clostridium sp. CM027]MBW9148444.1 peptidase domain-containing ABC transporter [Clostridium sp. CM028]UVE40336.1 peptidase domain-containing ABC transporter [Clostridium sp. CM027]WLC61017.1 peptidase domain-containing ABC transporter [Clostridium sp. CM028]